MSKSKSKSHSPVIARPAHGRKAPAAPVAKTDDVPWETAPEPATPAPVAPAETPAAADAPAADAPAADAPKTRGRKPASWKSEKATRLQHNITRARWFAELITQNGGDKALADKILAASSIVEASVNEWLKSIDDTFDGVVPSISWAREKTTTSAGATGERKGLLKAGSKVRMKAESLKRFGGMFSPAELASLQVVATKGAMVELVTGTGGKLVITAKQLEEVEATAAA